MFNVVDYYVRKEAKPVFVYWKPMICKQIDMYSVAAGGGNLLKLMDDMPFSRRYCMFGLRNIVLKTCQLNFLIRINF